jgi:hypothetical protein
MDKIIKEIFDEIDTSKNGEIDWLELKSFLLNLSNKLSIPVPTPNDVDRFIK